MRSKQMTIIWIPPDLIEPPHKTPLTLLMCGVDNHMYIEHGVYNGKIYYSENGNYVIGDQVLGYIEEQNMIPKDVQNERRVQCTE